jgi:hypothetical protein
LQGIFSKEKGREPLWLKTFSHFFNTLSDRLAMVTLPFPSLNFFVASGDDFKTFQKAKRIYYEQKMQIFYFCGAASLRYSFMPRVCNDV